MANIISRTKASSHPTPKGGVYVGVVKSISSNERLFVSIPKLGTVIGPLRAINAVAGQPYPVGTQVLCAYTNASNTEMYVIGQANPTAMQLDANAILATQVFG